MNRFIKFIVSVTAVIVLLIVILMASLPTLVTKFAKNRILYTVNQTIPGKVNFDDFSIGWFGGLHVDNFELNDLQGNRVISFEQLEADMSPLDLINRRFKWGSFEISNLNATIEMDSSGVTNIEDSLGRNLFPRTISLKKSVTLHDAFVTAKLLGDEIQLDMKGETEQGSIQGGFNLFANIKGKEIVLRANISDFPVAILDSIIALNNPQLTGILSEVVGDSFTVNIDQKQDDIEHTFKIDAKSPHLSANFNGHVIDGIISLDTPGTFSIDSTTEKLKNWDIKQFNGVKFVIEKMEIPVSFFTPGQEEINPKLITLTSNFDLEKIQYQTKDVDLSLLNLTGKLESLRDINDFTLAINGTLEKDSSPVKFQLDSKFEKPSHINHLVQKLNEFTDFQMRIEDLPTKTLDRALSTNEYFYNSLGDHVSIAFRGTSQDYGSLNLQLESNKIAIPKMKVKINEASSPNGDLSKMNVSGKFEIDKIIFREEPPETTLSDLIIPWEYYGLSKNFNGKLSGKTASGGSFSGKTGIKGWGSSEGSSVTAQFNGNEIPAHFFHFITGRPLFAAIFGEFINTDLNVNLHKGSGNTHLRLKGKQGYLTLNGKVAKGILTLNEPLYLETQPTKKLGEEVIAQFAPPLSQVVSGSAPITLQINPKGFSMPLFDFDVNRVEIPSGTMELGKLNFRNQGDIKKIARFLNSTKSENVSIQFTPQYFQMRKGVIQLERMDLLIDETNPLATWGKVDFLADYVNIKIGISGIALMNAFKLQNIERDVMLQVPLKGPIKDAKVDLSNVSTQIGAYLAKSGGTPHGLLIGTVLNLANGSSKVPPPTTNPLPWQKLLDKQNGTQAGDKPTKVKELEKGAKDLIKGIFKKN